MFYQYTKVCISLTQKLSSFSQGLPQLSDMLSLSQFVIVCHRLSQVCHSLSGGCRRRMDGLESLLSLLPRYVRSRLADSWLNNICWLKQLRPLYDTAVQSLVGLQLGLKNRKKKVSCDVTGHTARLPVVMASYRTQ